MVNTNRDCFLVVDSSSIDGGLKKELTEIISELKYRDVSILQLTLSVDEISTRFLCTGDWLSFHNSGIVSVYPMSNVIRQKERTDEVFTVLEENNLEINNVVDFTEAETEGYYLEGLGSIVLDRDSNVAYASISKKCDEDLFIEFCEELEFTPIVFHAKYKNNLQVDSTSEILNISHDFVLIASGTITDKKERKLVVSQLKKSGKEVIFTTESQVGYFISDISQVKNNSGDSFILLSTTIFDCLTDDQKISLEKYGEFLLFECSAIEKHGKHSIGSMLNKVV